MKKILIITYYWPPSGGSGVQRWLFFSKYLRLYGWEPVIYTVSNGEYPYLDPGLEKHLAPGMEIIKRPIWEPYSIFKKLSGDNANVNPTIMSELEQGNFFKKMLLWVRGNLFIPDARMFWIWPSIRFLKKYIKKHPIDLIVSTGPPHSTHLIARKLKRKLKIKWVADFRDPWTQIYSFKQLHLTSPSNWIHHLLERSVLLKADRIITVSYHCKSGFEKLVQRNIDVITNGYEEFEINGPKPDSAKIRMLYAGVLSHDRNPQAFWKILEDYIISKPDLKDRFELCIVGNVDSKIIESLMQSKLRPMLNIKASMPHKELETYLSDADILLLIGVPDHPEVLTGKLFEYLYLKKPIYSISPAKGDLDLILNETNSGVNADFNDEENLMKNLDIVFGLSNKNQIPFQFLNSEKYSRKKLTAELSNLFYEVLKS